MSKEEENSAPKPPTHNIIVRTDGGAFQEVGVAWEGKNGLSLKFGDFIDLNLLRGRRLLVRSRGPEKE